MKSFLVRVLWFIVPAGIGAMIIVLSTDLGINDSIFTAPIKYPSFWSILGGIIFYGGFLANIYYILAVWINAIFKR